MIEIDTNEQFIVYAIHNNCGRWYVTDKEIWYLDYKKKVDLCRQRGYEIEEEYIDEIRRDLQYINDVTALTFLKRVEKDIVST